MRHFVMRQYFGQLLLVELKNIIDGQRKEECRRI